MNELSLNILDIVQNSVVAGASRIGIAVTEDPVSDVLSIVITDDGCGMSEEFVKNVLSPFTTTRTTRKVGLGLPMLNDEAEATGGGVSIVSSPGNGATVTAKFGLAHLDRPPLGALWDTYASLVLISPEIDFSLAVNAPQGSFEVDTTDLRAELGDVPLSSPEVIDWLRSYCQEEIEALNLSA